MVMYEEDINLPTELQKTLFKECKSLLVIGTSLNVEPVSLLPARVSTDTTIHIVSKELDFQHYFSQPYEEKNMYHYVLQRRIDRTKYKTYDENKLAVDGYMQGYLKLNTQALNTLTPLFNFHQGECDLFVQDILDHFPQV